MDHPQASPEAMRHYEQVAARLAARGAKTSGMFGMPTLKLDGKALAGLYGDAMVFKLDGDAHAAALRLPGAHLFDPSGRGRPIKAWVVVSVAYAAEWERLAVDALAAIDG
ncbi:MAG: hypothetical protein OEW24_09735 [Chloroflexota bacterium]|nr:hypothetical protein [Chloroflexota bacterium]